jgi:uncharacterized protein with PIN domain
MNLDRSRAYWTMRVALLTVFVAAGAVPREVLDMARRNLEKIDMTCPVCRVELEHRAQEEVTEQLQHGDYPTHSVTRSHSYRCPNCRRMTTPHGAELFARMEAREWREE